LQEAIANLNTITMPETFGDFEIILPSDIISADLLPEAEPGLLELNLARITPVPVPGEEPRLEPSQLPFDQSQGELFPINTELGLLDPSISDVGYSITEPTTGIPPQVDILPEPIIPDVELPILPPIPIPESSSSPSISEKELAIEQMPELTPAAQRLRNKRYKVDKRTELSEAVMSKTIKDTSSLLRRLERAPPTRELMRLRQIEIEAGPLSFFKTPNDPFLAPELSKLIERTMCRRDQLDLPPVEESSSDIETRRKEQREPEEYIPPVSITEPPIGEESFPEIPLAPSTTIETGEETKVTTKEGEEEEEEVKGLVITHRTAAVHQFLTKNFDESGNVPLSFLGLIKDKRLSTVAITFFELLNIRSKNCINCQQDQFYGDIIISKTEYFDRI